MKFGSWVTKSQICREDVGPRFQSSSRCSAVDMANGLSEFDRH